VRLGRRALVPAPPAEVLLTLVDHVRSRGDLTHAVQALWVGRDCLRVATAATIVVEVECDPDAHGYLARWSYPVHGIPDCRDFRYPLRQALRAADPRLRVSIRDHDQPGDNLGLPTLIYAKGDDTHTTHNRLWVPGHAP
jgi:hypothetical protein